MLQALRNSTKIIFWIVAVAFIGFIVLVWGADLRFGGNRQGTIGKVNGQVIPYSLYQRQLAADLQRVRARSDRPTQFEDERRVSEQTWESIVNEILISQEARKDALPVSDGEVVFWVKSNPPRELMQNPAFIDSTTGQFDIGRYQELLRRSPEQFRLYEAYTRAQIPATKLQQNVLSTAKVSNADVDAYVRDRFEAMRASFVWVDPSGYPTGSTEVSEAEARAYYDAHHDEFKSGPRARLVVVRLPKEPSPQDSTDAFDEVRGFASTIARGDATFAALAESFSQDAFAERGGDRGRPYRRAELEAELAERVFSTPVGQTSEPFTAGNRILLVQVAGDTLMNGEPARRFSSIERRIEPGADRMTELRTRAREINQEAGRGNLAAAGLAAQAKVDTTALFERASFSPLLMGLREAVDFAFEHPAGAIGRPVETATDFVIYQVLERRDAEALPLEEVQARVKRMVVRDRQKELARVKANALAAALAAGQPLEAVAKAEGLEVRDSGRFTRKGGIPAVGNDAGLLGPAFALPAASTSKLIETDKGFFVVRADSLFPVTGPELDQQRTSARMMLERERQNQVYEAWLKDLKTRADIEDHRETLF